MVYYTDLYMCFSITGVCVTVLYIKNLWQKKWQRRALLKIITYDHFDQVAVVAFPTIL